jgi:uncharacterized coiled-coil DUF342 family protein
VSDTQENTIEQQLASMTELAQSLESVAKEQKIHLDGLQQRSNALRIERDRFERQVQQLTAELSGARQELDAVKQTVSKIKRKDAAQA